MIEQIYRQTCLNREFELKVADLHRQGKIKIPIYLSLGTEHVPPAIAAAYDDWAVFPQHRCHSYYLTFGGTQDRLMKELLGEDGYGRQGSASLSVPGRVFGHDGLLGSNVPIGVGYAHASGRPTLIHVGDAGIEEDYALAAMGYAASKMAPVLIIVECNGLSILTPVAVRRSWDVVSVARAFGLWATEIEDHPMTIYETVREYQQKMPALIQINVCRHLWHAGSGSDGPPEWNRFEQFEKEMENADRSGNN